MNTQRQSSARALIASAVAVLLFAGCEQQQPELPEPPAAPTFVGSWRTAGKIAIFKADGSLILRDNVPFLSTDSEQAIKEYSGKFEVASNGNLVLQMDGGPIPSGEYETTLTADTLLISTWDGPKGRAWFWNRLED